MSQIIRHYFLVVFLLLSPIAEATAETSYPARGSFNGFLKQINILECENNNQLSITLSLKIKEGSGLDLGEFFFSIPAFGSRHVILNDLANILDKYGTFEISILTLGENLGDFLACRTAFYRLSQAAALKQYEFAYIIPLSNPYQGVLGGIYNSIDPAAGLIPTFNWLSIINHSNNNFKALLEIYSIDGIHINDIAIGPLVEGARIDIPLGHTTGQTSGMYRIVPDDLSQNYEALLMRYHTNDGQLYDFAFPVQGLRGNCAQQRIQLSSMGNGLTDNWIEIGNLSNIARDLTLRIRNRFGTPLSTVALTINPFNQQHIYASTIIDPSRTGNVGSAELECQNENHKLILQSAFYGKIPGVFGVEWAYISQSGLAAVAEDSQQLHFPLNTFLSMANWVKLTELANITSSFSYAGISQAGAKVFENQGALNPLGTADIGLHEHSGQNFIGTAISWSNTTGSAIQGEILRVLPRVDGQIGYITPINATSQPKTELPAADSAYFPPGAVWYQDISQAAVDSQSSTIISWLNQQGGWGSGSMRIDFSIEVLEAPLGTTYRSFIATDDFYSPDCDLTNVPVPVGGSLEGENGYSCDSDGDCHLLVVDRAAKLLFEMWRANIAEPNFFGGCLAVWDMSRVYGASGRGENCTSADAGGLPIAPLLFSADEVAAGEINHAIRFILPNSRIRHRIYVHPATHSTGAASGGASAPPYGARLRLRADYPLNTLPNDGARVVARAMQKYGIILTDAGTIALTAQSDRYTTAKWENLLSSHDLTNLQVGDFEMIDGGPRISFTGDCVREP